MTRAIADFGMVGDGSCAALIDRAGALVWLCWPNFDSPAIFASLVGGKDNGAWTIAPTEKFRATRRYIPDTLILETRFETDAGIALLTDFMPYQAKQQAVIRRLRCLSGTVNFAARFAPRLDGGRETPRYERKGDWLLTFGEGLALTLEATRPALIGAETETTFELGEGTGVDFVLSGASSPVNDVAAYADEAQRSCDSFWRAWAARCTYQGPWRGAVVRSLITLKALIHAPSGGIVAAPTASLPERMGGHRNWDYRYCWLRDSTFTVLALLHAGYTEEAGAWVNWLIHAIDPRRRRTQVFYGLVPNTEIDEFEATWLAGFNGSRPVRFGNGARDQVQLGIYGEVQDTLLQWRLNTSAPEPQGWERQCAMVARLETLLDQPDAGIWEQRNHAEFFTQSRGMAWAAFDRVQQTAERFDYDTRSNWNARRDALHAEICEKGYDSSLGSFSRAYGSHSLDASCLLLAMIGFLPPDDPRIVGTVAAISRHLAHGPFVYRYDVQREDDGVGGPEGAFLACSYWLADNLVLQHRMDEASTIFEQLLPAGNDLGLFSEEYDPSAKALLGNFPQALTHLSLVHTALNLTGSGPAHSRSTTSH